MLEGLKGHGLSPTDRFTTRLDNTARDTVCDWETSLVLSLVLESSTPQADFQFGGSDWALWHSTELCPADGCCTGGIPMGLVEFDLLMLVGGWACDEGTCMVALWW